MNSSDLERPLLTRKNEIVTTAISAAIVLKPNPNIPEVSVSATQKLNLQMLNPPLRKLKQLNKNQTNATTNKPKISDQLTLFPVNDCIISTVP